MANVFNALTTGTGGIATSGDSTGAFAFTKDGGTASVTIDATGNVGVGTSSPATKLQVSGTGSQEFRITSNTSGDIRIGIDLNGAAYNWIDNYRSSSAMAFATANAERMRIDASGYITNQANGNTAGLVQGYKYYRLDSGYAGSNVNTVQPIFGVGVTLSGSTVYEFEIVIYIAKSAGTTAHTMAIGFGGTATLNNILWQGLIIGSSSSVPLNNTGSYYTISNSANAFVVTGSVTTASYFDQAIIKGTVSINAGGTFIPQYTLSAAPGGAYTTQAGSYIKISPISASGANTNIGTWA